MGSGRKLDSLNGAVLSLRNIQTVGSLRITSLRDVSVFALFNHRNRLYILLVLDTTAAVLVIVRSFSIEGRDQRGIHIDTFL